MKNKAVFLDRDGTINIDLGYIGNPELIKLFPDVAEGIKKLKDNFSFKVFVISNQSGVTRGLISKSDVDEVNERINQILEKNGTGIDKFYYCPYHPDFDSGNLTKCRKPSPEMVFQAQREFEIDLSKSFFIGDRSVDIECGINAGVKTILLKNTLSNEEIIMLKNSKNSPNFVAANFENAVEYIESFVIGDFF
ncbi:MAG: HAD family hydrolase [Ignavibacteriae bacterium]|jgi:D-glycero-D-manno-heptose 1,7-bisphosphate phosphatase|nr:HAD family hydrolase [Ignavibacteriota bacterium]